MPRSTGGGRGLFFCLMQAGVSCDGLKRSSLARFGLTAREFHALWVGARRKDGCNRPKAAQAH
ncbi:hypothetical protein MPNT_30085 [Candidatus Methylacidithermus pantelleriae]|uniref:Uncharacterized protein n=1 Tax=Candidatus Methylacidithermus pantelleriae TaxID=2744239 RepID=A0A8J2BMG1_9BACT|nr:hypothetical protein MPNT_30085 [Candidatus Methylacidithermus pantelleriae]